MKRSRRLFSAFLTLCLVFTLLPLPARAADTSQYLDDGLLWSLENNLLTIKPNQEAPNATHVMVGGQNWPWESQYGDIRNIDITSGVKGIGANVFVKTAVETLKISETVVNIDPQTFNGLDFLRSITVDSKNPKFCAEGNFLYAHNENNVKTELVRVVPNGSYLPYQVPATITKIWPFAFSNTNIRELTIPDNVTSIGSCAFYYSGVTDIILPDSIESIEPAENLPSNIPNTLAYRATYLTSMTVSGGLKTVPHMAAYCTSLETVTFSPGVETISGAAFANCDSMTTINFPSTLKSIDSSAFSDCYKSGNKPVVNYADTMEN